MRQVISQPLDTGHCRHPQAMTIRGGSWRPAAFPSVAMLIRHPEEGPILFDTGYDPAFLAATHPFPERLYRWATPVNMQPGRDAASQLGAAGIDPLDVRHVVISHFHGDHVAGLHAFPHAQIHCARAGLDHIARQSRLSATAAGLLPRLLPADLAARARHFEDGQRVALPPDCHPFETGVDLLGDGVLIAIELPGHCPGHWGLMIHDARWGLHFMVADAAWSCAAIRTNTPPPWLTTALLGHTGRLRDTLGQLHQLHRRNPEMRLSPCHCAERAAEIETDP